MSKLSAILALGEIGDEKAIPIIEQALKSPIYDEWEKEKCIAPALEMLRKRLN